MEKINKNLVFVDCEARGGAPAVGKLKEVGAVLIPNFDYFHGDLRPYLNDDSDEYFAYDDSEYFAYERIMYIDFEEWLKANIKGQPVFVSDNPAWDWQWINDGFWKHLGRNPFGHSARRISDYYAGLRGNFRKTQEWKRLRITKHDHNPVNDARGNAEAFLRIEEGER